MYIIQNLENVEKQKRKSNELENLTLVINHHVIPNKHIQNSVRQTLNSPKLVIDLNK